MRRKKQSELTDRKKQLLKEDALARKRCKEKGVCEFEGVDGRACCGPLTWAHIIRRKHSETRTLDENGLCLCLGHHQFYDGRQKEFENIVESLYPGRMNYLNSLIRRIVK